MDSFESALARSMKEACSDVMVPGAMKGQVLRRARVRRTTAVVAGVAGMAAVFALLLTIGGDSVVVEGTDLPPAGPNVAPYEGGPVTGGCGIDPIEGDRLDVPDGAICGWTARGDVDGDGELETVYTYGEPQGEGEGREEAHWFVEVVDIGRAWRKSLHPLPSLPSDSFVPFEPRLMGTVDASGDGRSEIFVALEVGNGVSAGIFFLDQEGLKPVLEADQRFLFSVTASVNYRAGLTCESGEAGEPPALVVRRAQVNGSGNFDLTTIRYLWNPDGSVRTDGSAEEKADEEDPSVQSAGDFHCFGLGSGALGVE